MPRNLNDIVRAHALQPAPEAALALASALRERHGDCVKAILFHGSGLRDSVQADSVLDLYVLADRYSALHPTTFLALANRLLPPNVFWIEHPWNGTTLRAKYATLTLDHFERLVSPRTFHSSFWGRFAQPARLIWTADDTTRERVIAALAAAIRTLMARTLPLQPASCDTLALWETALGASYRAELRPESPGRAAQLVAADAAYYREITSALHDSGDPCLHATGHPFVARMAWALRRFQGVFLSIARWLKALATFHDGVDYALWKLERHTGHRIMLSDWQRRHPRLGLWGVLWRLYREGALR